MLLCVVNIRLYSPYSRERVSGACISVVSYIGCTHDLSCMVEKAMPDQVLNASLIFSYASDLMKNITQKLDGKLKVTVICLKVPSQGVIPAGETLSKQR